MRSLWIGFARLLIRGIFGILFHVRVEGELPKSGPLIVVANHQGWADGFLLVAAFPFAARVRFLGDRDGTMSVWWHRLLLTSLGLVIPIDRTRRSADRAALGATMDALARGEVVIVFAEGRVSHAEATLGEFARGVGYLALRSGAPVLPMWLSGRALSRSRARRRGRSAASGREGDRDEGGLARARGPPPCGSRGSRPTWRGRRLRTQTVALAHRPLLGLDLPQQHRLVDDADVPARDLDESPVLEVGEQLVHGHARRPDRRGEVVLREGDRTVHPRALHEVLREPAGDIEEREVLGLALEVADRSAQPREHELARLLVAAEDRERAVARDLQRRGRDDRRRGPVARCLLLEERELTEELTAHVQRDEQLMAGLV